MRQVRQAVAAAEYQCGSRRIKSLFEMAACSCAVKAWPLNLAWCLPVSKRMGKTGRSAARQGAAVGLAEFKSLVYCGSFLTRPRPCRFSRLQKKLAEKPIQTYRHWLAAGALKRQRKSNASGAPARQAAGRGFQTGRQAGRHP